MDDKTKEYSRYYDNKKAYEVIRVDYNNRSLKKVG